MVEDEFGNSNRSSFEARSRKYFYCTRARHASRFIINANWLLFSLTYSTVYLIIIFHSWPSLLKVQSLNLYFVFGRMKMHACLNLNRCVTFVSIRRKNRRVNMGCWGTNVKYLVTHSNLIIHHFFWFLIEINFLVFETCMEKKLRQNNSENFRANDIRFTQHVSSKKYDIFSFECYNVTHRVSAAPFFKKTVSCNLHEARFQA